MYEMEDHPVGAIVLTPLGRRAIVKRHLTGASKKDHFSRLICQYEGIDDKDLVTLQPHHLRPVEVDTGGSPLSAAPESQKSSEGGFRPDTSIYELTVAVTIE
jgi:hypothetical protein